MLEKNEEGVDWCGSNNLGEEQVLGEVSEWVQKESVLESTHRCDSIENYGGERT